MTGRPLEGQTALVTGGARRIGRAICEALAAQGADLVIHYRSSVRAARALAAELEHRHGVRGWTLQADLDRPSAASRLFHQAQRRASVSILVNNASIFPAGTLEKLDMGSLVRNLRINTFSPFVLARELARSGHPGQVVNLLDTRILSPDSTHTAYHLSKRALFSLTRLMALEFAPRIRVNAVAPGLVLPPVGKPRSVLRRMAHTNPLHTHGTPAQVADAVTFLVLNPFVTGQVIFVDGGRHLHDSLYGC
jgi:NAD(P)-dependent dehydrogenase (short-subunit alcohol dehydrogenase family)